MLCITQWSGDRRIRQDLVAKGRTVTVVLPVRYLLGCGEQRNTSARAVDKAVRTRTKHLSNTNVDCYRYTNLFDDRYNF
jgi:hypothetical protein